jgi:hypothetical protein
MGDRMTHAEIFISILKKIDVLTPESLDIAICEFMDITGKRFMSDMDFCVLAGECLEIIDKTT